MADPDKKGGGVARREAQPIPWEHLTEEQRAAATQACSILGELAEQAWEAPTEERSGLRRFLPRIDQERLNHVVLLDGGRGSGKTALFITLLDAWSWRVLRESGDRRSAREGPGTEAGSSPEFDALLAQTARVVPVGLVDLQPLPASTHLMMHLVGQFLPLVEAIEADASGGADRARRAAWHDAEGDEPKSTKAWRDFLRAAAAGWDGSLAERRAKLDPEAYALEVEHAERRRLDVRSTFRALMDALVEDFSAVARWSNGKPLFVVPIDDADMNPARVMELLDLVRTLWHPRVAFLLTGHSKLFLSVLRAHTLQALRAPLRPGMILTEAERDSLHRPEDPKELAEDIYAKVIPRGHRCRLPDISPESRLKILRNQKVLAKVNGPAHPLGLESLEEYFTLQQQACGVLPGRMRALIDFSNRISQFLMEGQRLSSSERKQLPSRLPREVLASLLPGHEHLQGDLDDRENKVAALRIVNADTASQEPWIGLLRGAGGVPLHGPVSIIFSHRFEVHGKKNPPASLITAVDAIGMMLGNWKLGLRTFIVETRIKSADQPLDYRFSWPLPDWNTFLDYAAFSHVWFQVAGIDGSAGSEKVSPGNSRPIENRTTALAADLGETVRNFIATVLGYIKLIRERSRMAPDASPGSAIVSLNQLAMQLRDGSWTWEELAKVVAAPLPTSPGRTSCPWT